MKKTFAVIAAVLFVLSFAASAFAIHAEIPAETQAVVAKSATQITLGGEIRVRGWYTNNLGDAVASHTDLRHFANTQVEDYIPHFNNVFVGLVNVPAHNDVVTVTKKFAKYGVESQSKAWYDQRVRLYVDAKVSDNVQGFVQLETGTADQPGKGDYLTSTADKYFWGNFNAKPNTSMGILEAWILYKGTGLFGFNSGLKIGHMPLKLGEGQFFDHTQLGDDAIVFFMDPMKQMHIGLLTIKFAGDEGQTLNVPLLGITSSGPGSGLQNGVRADNTDDLDGYVALMTYKIDDKNTVGINYTYLNLSDAEFSHQNLGLHANGSFGNFGYKAEVDFQFGKVGDTKFRGDAVMVAGNYKMGAANLRGSFAWGSGDGDSSDDKIKTFIPYVSAVQNYTLIYDYLATTTAGGLSTGLANTTYYNLGLDYAANKDLSFSIDGYILRASKTEDGISKSAGWEVDGKMVYKIAKNLTYQIDAGYFKPGSFYDDTLDRASKDLRTHDAGGSWLDHISFDQSSIKGITVLRNMLTLSF